jgi:sugar phosphate permease
MVTSSKNREKIHFAWLIWGLAAFFYFSDYMARVAPTVMHHDLQADFSMNEAGFGLLTSSFYIPYVLMQIPVGLLVDRVSIRWLLTLMSLLTALGCCVFGLADNLLLACVGRMLVGFSAAFAFISALRLATSWFPAAMLGLLAGLTQALGMLGGAAGQAPISFLVTALGWRYSMQCIALLFVVLAGLLFYYIQDKPGSEGDELTIQRELSIFASLKLIVLSRQTWINALYAGFLYAPAAVLGEAIGPAYLQYGQGMNAHAAAFATSLIFMGWVLGGPLSGWLSDKMGRRKPVMIVSAFCGLVFISLLVYYPHLSAGWAYVLLILFGFTNTGVALAYAVSTELHVRKVVGTAIAFTNMASIFIGALLQPIVGYCVDFAAGIRSYHVDSLLLSDFQAGLQLLPLSSLVALLLACIIKETYCRGVKK